MYLKTHEWIHTGVKLYECKHCTKDFHSPSNLQRHTQTNPGAKHVSSVGKPPLVECPSKTWTKSQSTGVLYM
jgi:hypothetical protein